MFYTDNRKKIAFHTLGCKLNFAETSTMSRTFPPDKFLRVPANSKADIYVINTCTVTDAADKKCRQAIRKFINLSPDAFIAVVGCYAQLNPDAISSIPGVDLVLGTNEKFDISEYLVSTEKKSSAEVHSCNVSDSGKFYQSSSIGDRTRSFLKVQDGCDYHCSYCTIPSARGKSRNPEISSVIREARQIASGGVKEIVLTGVNTGDFGKTTGESFPELLKALIDVDGVERYRISSIEPNLLTDEIIGLAASGKKIMPHFHIPLQSGSDKILGLMRRRYKRDVFAGRVNRIKEMIPLAGIGADVIVGFPGETADDFNDTYEFIKTLPLSYLHVFPFSARPGTPASALKGMVSYQEKMRRSKLLLDLSAEMHTAFCKSNTSLETNILFESAKSGGMISGFTPNYLRVEFPWTASLAGTIRKARLEDIAPDGRMTIELLEK